MKKNDDSPEQANMTMISISIVFLYVTLYAYLLSNRKSMILFFDLNVSFFSSYYLLDINWVFINKQ